MYLEALLALECEERDRHAVANRVREAQLPRLKALEEFDFAQAPQIPAAKIRELAEGGYIERSEPVVLSANVEPARGIWQPDFAWLRANRSAGCASRQPRPWSMSWSKPSSRIRCGG
jgi:hypothetical protein